MADIKGFIIPILVFSGIMVGAYTFVSDLSVDFSENLAENTTDYRTLSQMELISNKSVAMAETYKTKMTSGSGSIVDIAFIQVKGFLDFIDLTGTILFSSWTQLFSGLADTFNIPPWFVGMITGIVIVLILLTIISAIIKWVL